MKKLLLSFAMVLCALGSYAQFGTITFNQDTVVIIRRLKIMTLRPGSTSDSIIVHKANGNIGGLAMNQFVVPWTNVSGKPTFATVATSGDYNDLINKPSITNYTPGTGISIASGIITNTAPAITRAVNNNVSRSLNSNYTISTTREATVSYTVRIAYNITVLLGSTGSMSLQYSTNGGSSWLTVQTVSNSLNLGLALTGYNDFSLNGVIPANALVRINSTVTNATNSYITGQEVY